MPPRVASAPGSTGKNRPVSLRCPSSCLRVTPACTQQSMSGGETCGEEARGRRRRGAWSHASHAASSRCRAGTPGGIGGWVEKRGEAWLRRGRGEGRRGSRAPACTRRCIHAGAAPASTGRALGGAAASHRQHAVHAGQVQADAAPQRRHVAFQARACRQGAAREPGCGAGAARGPRQRLRNRTLAGRPACAAAAALVWLGAPALSQHTHRRRKGRRGCAPPPTPARSETPLRCSRGKPPPALSAVAHSHVWRMRAVHSPSGGGGGSVAAGSEQQGKRRAAGRGCLRRDGPVEALILAVLLQHRMGRGQAVAHYVPQLVLGRRPGKEGEAQGQAVERGALERRRRRWRRPPSAPRPLRTISPALSVVMPRQGPRQGARPRATAATSIARVSWRAVAGLPDPRLGLWSGR